MQTLKARVEHGRLILDEPTKLPEGTVLELAAVDAGDDLSEEERAALHAALVEAWASVKAGDLRPAEELIEELRNLK